MYYTGSEHKGAKLICEADLRLCFQICKKKFSRDAAYMKKLSYEPRNEKAAF